MPDTTPSELSPQQHHLWHLDPAEGPRLYRAVARVDVRGALERRRLSAALREVIECHQILRTTIEAAGGATPRPRAQEAPALEESYEDWSKLPERDRETAIRERFEALAEGSGNAGDARGLRHLLIRLAASRHVLLLALPALCADRQGLRNLVQEIAAAYAAPGERARREAVQYTELAAWQRDLLESDDTAEGRDYWAAEKIAPPAGRRLPGSAGPARPGDFRPRRIPEALPPGLEARLGELGEVTGTSETAIYLAAWQVLLGRIAGAAELAVNVRFDGRKYPQLEDALGLLDRFLPLPARLEDKLPFTDLARALDAAIRERRDWQEFYSWPAVFGDAVEPADRFLPFAFEDAPPAAPISTADLELAVTDEIVRSDRFQAMLGVERRRSGVSLALHYDAGAWPETTARWLARSLTTLLAGVCERPDTPLGELPIQAPNERQLLLAELNDTGELGKPRPLPELFAERAGEVPDRIAVSRGGEHLSYRALEQRSARAASWLAGRGVGAEDLVGVHLERSPELAVTLLAILRAGAAYLPLDPAYPEDRLAFIASDAGLRWLVTDARGDLPWVSGDLDVVSRRDFDRGPAESAEAPEPLGIEDGQLAYVIYTSGSTGRPKGVQVAHATLASFLAAMAERPGLDASDTLLALTSISFDIAALELFLPLSRGARVEVASSGLAADGTGLLAESARCRATVVQATPATWRILVEALAEDGSEASLDGLRALCGGEAMPADLAAELAHRSRSLWNLYGPTETTVWSTVARIPRNAGRESSGRIDVGRPIAGTRVYLLDDHGRPVPLGADGELVIGGAGVARGYRGRPATTAERFVPDPFGPAGSRLYRTGDRARLERSGKIDFLGRFDHQVKLRGFRIELEEIADALARHPAIAQAVVRLWKGSAGQGAAAPAESFLAAYVVLAGRQQPAGDELRSFLKGWLPEPMVPAHFVTLDRLPLTPNGKVNRRALPPPEGTRDALGPGWVAPRSEVERRIAAIWRRVLGVEKVGAMDNFFDLGGHSLLLHRVFHELRRTFPSSELSRTDLFRYPTVAKLADHLGGALPPGERPVAAASRHRRRAPRRRPAPGESSEIAIIGLGGRFPGASNVEEFWRNLRAGVETISFFTDDELRREGLPDDLLARPDFVKARPLLADPDLFDAEFFGLSPREAELTDPQQRVFLECAWQTLESAGHDPATFDGVVGLWAGMSISRYWAQLMSDAELVGEFGELPIMFANDKDYLAPRVAYKLDLHGPAVNVQTACSTSLVATHMACQSLLRGECDLALAGGVSIHHRDKGGYFYREDGILSPDGHCRTFDAAARGTIFGSGAGVVALRRLADALDGGDRVVAVIRGSAINSDGAEKIGFTAPSVQGQAAVIREALEIAGVAPETVTYIEAHGTATPLGDPVEVAALREVFGAQAGERCALGSVKTNVGHLDAAAGVAGLIKTALALDRAELPPSLHFERPNPELALDRSPFFVNVELRSWDAGTGRRRAGVSSFGIGGTNAHAILEEAPPQEPSGPSRPWQLLTLSARSPRALEAQAGNLRSFLESHPEVPFADVAFTCWSGRRRFQHRRAVVCEGRERASAALADPEAGPEPRSAGDFADDDRRPVAFLFPGQGAQTAGMAKNLYAAEPAFRETLDRSFELLRPHLDFDLRGLLFGGGPEAAAVRLEDTAAAQPALFAVEHALARLWIAWGVVPEAMLGHSIGEYVAACLAGTFALEDALALVAERGRMMQALPRGAMLSVLSPPDRLAAYLDGGELSLAAVNGPERSVIAGPSAEIAELRRRLAGDRISSRPLATSHAFHSPVMDEILEPFARRVAEIERHPPEIPWVSNLSGTWIRPDEAQDPAYWARHLRHTVKFSDGLRTLFAEPRRVLLEVGPGHTLTSQASRHPERAPETPALASLPDAPSDDLATVLATLGRLWVHGAEIDRRGLYAGENRRRVPLPTYPFERRRFWIAPELRPAGARQAAVKAPPDPPPSAGMDRVEPRARRPASDGPRAELFTPTWQEIPMPPAWSPRDDASIRWLLLADAHGVAESLAAALSGSGRQATLGHPGDAFADLGGGVYRLRPDRAEDYERLMDALAAGSGTPDTIVHLWGWSAQDAPDVDAELARSFYSLLFLAQSLARNAPERPPRLVVVADGLYRVRAEDAVAPLKATALGPVKVIPLEYPNLRAAAIDLPPEPDGGVDATAERLLAEIAGGEPEPVVAYRAGRRWVQRFAVHAEGSSATQDRLRRGGAYLVTGGFGGLGAHFAEFLAREYGARLALVSRSAEGGAARNIRLLRRLESLGAEVLALSADVADAGRMREVVREVRSRFGALHGVLHAAGIAGGGGTHLRGAEEAAAVLRPKIHGTLSLAAALAGEPIDFLMLCSSTAAALGAAGQVDYAAANAFLDAFAHLPPSQGAPHTLSIGWDAWSETGMTARLSQGSRTEVFGGAALEPEDGAELLRRALRGSEPYVVASKRDFPTLLERSRNLIGTVAESAPAARSVARERHPRPEISAAFVAPRNEAERRIAAIWEEVLAIDRIGVDDLFFDLGGDSLLLMQVRNKMRDQLGLTSSMPNLFRYPTVAAQAKNLKVSEKPKAEARRATAPGVSTMASSTARPAPPPASSDVAIVGMAGRFPGANDIGEFWRNLRDGVESISFYSDEELEEVGYPPEMLAIPRFVKAQPRLEDGEWFDAQHFGIRPREAETIDPQQRVFLETAWEALEQAGYDPATYPGTIGCFAGAGVTRYWFNIASNPRLLGSVGILPVVIGNDKDYLPTRVSFKLDLKGPSVNVQSACSTSLIAIHLACRSILNDECDMALAGGVAMAGPGKGGYFYEDGGMLSPDGHCRAFDARAAGTIFGSGSGAVLLKRLDAALADNDTIHAVVKGTAINNDGSAKVGYTAPGVDGQVRVLEAALRTAGLTPDSVSYVEAHGTATQLGDPIEVAALREVFGDQPGNRCALGSVKSNIGHADAAAGVAGVLKTVLALEHRQIPPSLHFEVPNPEIDFENSPFYVNTALSEWPANGGHPRRAGVSAFGVGGSNAHVVLEEAPAAEPTSPSRPWQLLVLSARTATALDRVADRLAGDLDEGPDLPLADVAYTLQIGRRGFQYRRLVVCRDRRAGAAALRGEGGENALGPFNGQHEGEARSVVFLFPGQGAQYVDMGRELYATEEIFKAEVDRCAEILAPHLGLDLRTILYPSASPDDDPEEVGEAAAERLRQTRFTQPALFTVEYALARQWMAWGVEPDAMVGHSIGEYVAACLAGVFSLEDALAVVAARGRLMQSADPGAMLSVPLTPAELAPMLAEAGAADELSLATVNAPERVVVGGTHEAVARLETLLAGRDVQARRLHTSHAFHSPMMEPILEPFREELAKVELHDPERPFVSNLSGRFIDAAEARDPDYWVRHLRRPVDFSSAVATLCTDAQRVLVEVGPGRTLGSLARRHPAAKGQPVVYSMRHAREWASDQAYLLAALGRLWSTGYAVDWPILYGDERRRRVPLPTYPFERQRYYVEEGDFDGGLQSSANVKKKDRAEWFYVPTWKPSDLAASSELSCERHAPCLIFADGDRRAQGSLAGALATRLDGFEPVYHVEKGDGFSRSEDGRRYTLDPRRREDFEALIRDLHGRGQLPKTVLYLWTVTPAPEGEEKAEERERYLDEGIYALFFFVQLLEEIGDGDPLHLVVVSTGVHAVDGSETLVPEKATLVGPTTVIPQEYRNILCHSLDVVASDDWSAEDDFLEALLEELVNDKPEMDIAYRRRQRWVQSYEPVRIEARKKPRFHFREGGCYLITGGLGGLGLTFARHLAEEARAKLVLTGRSALPPRDAWPAYLAEHGEDDATGAKIRKVEALEALGAEVMVAAANVVDRERMAAVVAEARDRFGPIRGVLQAAGLPSGGLAQHKTREMIEDTLLPKVHGTRVLEAVLADEPLDFFVLFSSSGAILGGLGYFDYCAANAFLDAFAHHRTARGAFTQSINWGAWKEVGMAVVSNLGFTSEEDHKAFLSRGIGTDEGLEIFHRILDRRIPQVAVWPMDFGRMIEGSRLLEAIDETERGSIESAHPRPPDLSSAYQEPRNEIEEALAAIWQELLGIDRVGVADDFFEMGADSLLATQMLSRVRRKLGAAVPIHPFYEGPTIAALGELIGGLEEEQAGELDEVEALLSEVEAMSDSDLEMAESDLEKATP